MRKNLPFRAWVYFRQGWVTYFAFIFAAINTLTVTYYLAIEKIPSLNLIFPSFINYILIMSIIGIPILVLVGYIHFKRVPAFKAEQEINVEANPWMYKLLPGYIGEVLYPSLIMILNLLTKLTQDEQKLTEEELKTIKELRKKYDILFKGGYIGDYKRLKDKTSINDLEKD